MDEKIWYIVFGILIGLVIFLGVLILALRWHRGRSARKGRRAEKEVATLLKTLKKRDNIVFNDLLLVDSNGRTTQMDHLVISRRGIFVIETKSHAGRISGSEFSQYWSQHFSTQTRQFYNPLLQNATHIRVLRRLLPEIEKDLMVSVVLFTEAWRLDLKADEAVKHRPLLPDRHIRRTFRPSERKKRRWWCPWREVWLDENKVVVTPDELIQEINRRRKMIDRSQLREIAEKIEENRSTDRDSRRAHTDYAKTTARNISREIREGRCPRCGGTLVIKKGERGEFVGCERYPACRFTCSIDRLKN